MRAKNLVPGSSFGLERAQGIGKAWPQLPDSEGATDLADVIQMQTDYGGPTTLLFVNCSGGRQKLCEEAVGGWTDLQTGLPPALDRFIFGPRLYWLTGSDFKLYDFSSVSSVQQSIPSGQSSLTEADVAVWNKVKSAVAVEQRGQRWFYATTNNEIIFSEIGDPALIKPTSVINVKTRDYDTITALHEFNDGLLIFKKRSVHYLSGWDFDTGSDITLTQLNVTTGTSFPKTVCTTEKGVLYLGASGIYRLYVPGNSLLVAAENISDNKISQALFAEGTLETAFAIVYKGRYYITVKATGKAPREYRYYPDLDAFFGEFTHQPLSYSIMRDGRLCMGLANRWTAIADNARYRYIDTDSGNYVSIPVLAQTKAFDVSGGMVQNIRLSKLLLAAKQFPGKDSHMELRVRTDEQEIGYDVALLSAGSADALLSDEFWIWSETKTKQLHINRRAKRVAVSISDDTLEEPLLIYGLALLYKKRQIKGSTQGVAKLSSDEASVGA